MRIVALVNRGAAITLNGIAQGYATDRVVETLRGQDCRRRWSI
jgi:thiamine biosynthesis lipoprotein